MPGGAEMHCSFIYKVVWVFNRTLLKIQYIYIFFFLFKHDSFKFSFCDSPLYLTSFWDTLVCVNQVLKI